MTGLNNYPHLNLEYIYELADGETEFVKEIIDSFLTSTPINFAKLEEAISLQNGTDIVFYAHKLKGTFNFIGSIQLSNTFTTIESLSQDNDKYKEMEALLTLVKNNMVQIFAELNDLKSTLT